MTFSAYSAYGMRISSEIGLPLPSDSPPENHQRGDSGTEPPADVVIRWGDVPTRLLEPVTSTPVIQVTSRESLFCLPGAGRFLVREGRDVLVHSEAGAPESLLGLHLAHAGLATLLHQRGTQPLHASAVVVDGGCVAFLGGSGTGKSTMAAALGQRGYPALCDDICAVTFAEGAATVRQGTDRLQLWRDAAQALGLDCGSASRAHPVGERYNFAPSLVAHDQPIPLRRLYILRDSRLQPEGIIRLSGIDAFQRLFGHTYFVPRVASFVSGPTAFAAYAGIARTVPLFGWSRPRGFDRLGATIDSLEQHLRSDPTNVPDSAQ